jgi:hypothetical protein
VNILDENVVDSQRRLLIRWRVRIRQVGYEIGRKGLQDEGLIPLLLQLRRPTFFSRDRDFFDRQLCHHAYCLVQLAVRDEEFVQYVRRLLRHPAFDTQGKRMGSVLRVTSTGITVWRLHAEAEEHVSWPERRGRAQRPAAR